MKTILQSQLGHSLDHLGQKIASASHNEANATQSLCDLSSRFHEVFRPLLHGNAPQKENYLFLQVFLDGLFLYFLLSRFY